MPLNNNSRDLPKGPRIALATAPHARPGHRSQFGVGGRAVTRSLMGALRGGVRQFHVGGYAA